MHMKVSMHEQSWAVVATVKEDAETVKKFLAHYKAMGAREIHIFFDDPSDASYEIAISVEGVIPTLCTDAHWDGSRPARQERRQKINARLAYQATRCAWMIHLDADEYIYCPEGVQGLLAAAGDDESALRVVPAEPLVHPRTGDIKAYKSPLQMDRRGQRIAGSAYGDVAPLLEGGLLSHVNGKFFLRTGLADAPISIHRPAIPGADQIRSLPEADILLLHHHGGDEEEWIRKFLLRLETTYSEAFKDHRRRSGKVDGKGLNAYLHALYEDEGEAGLRVFYRKVFHLSPEKRVLRRRNAIHRVKVWLDQKSDDLFGDGTAMCRDFRTDPETGRLIATARFLGFSMTIEPDFNYTENVLAQGYIDEQEELEYIRDIVAGKRVNFWDIGSNTGIYSLLVGTHADPESSIYAFEPHPRMLKSIRRNIALNDLTHINVEPVALGAEEGHVALYVSGNLGESSIVEAAGLESIEVPVRRLKTYMERTAPADVSVMKIDIEGGEPIALGGFFAEASAAEMPDYILYEHAHVDKWEVPEAALFPRDVYEVERRFRFNTMLRRNRAGA